MLDPVDPESFNGGLFDLMHHRLDKPPRASEVREDIGHHLARTMISHLTASVRLYDGDVAGIEEMLGLASLTKRVDRLVFNEPDFI
jgi:hypothetical protein